VDVQVSLPRKSNPLRLAGPEERYHIRDRLLFRYSCKQPWRGKFVVGQPRFFLNLHDYACQSVESERELE
jgi:hypothetical protein